MGFILAKTSPLTNHLLHMVTSVAHHPGHMTGSHVILQSQNLTGLVCTKHDIIDKPRSTPSLLRLETFMYTYKKHAQDSAGAPAGIRLFSWRPTR